MPARLRPDSKLLDGQVRSVSSDQLGHRLFVDIRPQIRAMRGRARANDNISRDNGD
jgi:hypothetical protein